MKKLLFLFILLCFSSVSVSATSFHYETEDVKPKIEESSFKIIDKVGKKVGTIKVQTPYSIKKTGDYSFTVYRKGNEAGLVYISSGDTMKDEIDNWKSISNDIKITEHLPFSTEFNVVSVSLGPNNYYYIDFGNAFINITPAEPSDEDLIQTIVNGTNIEKSFSDNSTESTEKTEESTRVYKTTPKIAKQPTLFETICQIFDKIIKFFHFS